jgi:hypothetical protein
MSDWEKDRDREFTRDSKDFSSYVPAWKKERSGFAGASLAPIEWDKQ